MIPLKDTIPRWTFPVVTVAIIAVNSVLFLFEQMLPEDALNEVIYLFGLVPARYSHPEWAVLAGLPLDTFWPFVTNMFLHGGWLHLIMNMWSLWIFGDNVEERLGRVRFLLFYFLAGIAANIVQFVVNSDATVPVIGASGAIAGVMAAYLRLFPYARLLVVIPIIIIPYIVEIPAVFFIAFWFLMQLFSGAAALVVKSGEGIAWWAHVGGFAVGFWMVRPFCSRRLGGCRSDEFTRQAFR
ncbi:MAG: rhomboid family intramembrane serine protease [Nitrospiraceae bacterium]|nr:rhomboid family intramembrane serine protease [Nitrospiraceae bacterium]